MQLSVFSPILTRGMYAEPKEAIQYAVDLGITTVAIFGHELEKMGLSEYRKFYDAYGVKVSSIIQSAYLSDPDGDIRSKEVDKVKKVVDLVAENGANHIMVIPKLREAGYGTQVKTMADKLFVRDTIVSGMNEIVAYAKDTGVTLTLENYSEHAYPFSTMDEMLYMMAHIPGLKYTLDAGNFYCVKEDVLAAYQQLKDYLYNIHIKDWIPDEFGYIIRPEIPALSGCIMGEGILPLRELLSEIKKDGYDGEILLEYSSEILTKEIVKTSAEFVTKNMNKRSDRRRMS